MLSTFIFGKDLICVTDSDEEGRCDIVKSAVETVRSGGIRLSEKTCFKFIFNLLVRQAPLPFFANFLAHFPLPACMI